MAVKHEDGKARERLLQAALKHFAAHGYAGASVQDIVDTAGVTKPTLYYYFGNKAELYNALIDLAHDERLRLMQTAAARGRTLMDKLREIIAAQFAFVSHNRDLTRLGFATLFAASQEVPDQTRCLNRGKRNFDFIQQLVREGQASGELEAGRDLNQLTMGIYGMMAFHVLRHLVEPSHKLTPALAENLVKLFFDGAALHSRSANSPKKGRSLP